MSAIERRRAPSCRPGRQCLITGAIIARRRRLPRWASTLLCKNDTVAMASTTEAPSEVGLERPKVVYVMGAGRSGSTILGVTLGNCADVFFAGELDKWLALSGKPTGEDTERVRF